MTTSNTPARFLCHLGLHKYSVLKTHVACDEVKRAHLKCERCQKEFHVIVLCGQVGIGDYEPMREFWEALS